MTENDEIQALWQENHDLNRLEIFFDALNPQESDKDRIKDLTLQKIQKVKKDNVSNLQSRISNVRRKFKFGMAVAALVLITLVGLLHEDSEYPQLNSLVAQDHVQQERTSENELNSIVSKTTSQINQNQLFVNDLESSQPKLSLKQNESISLNTNKDVLLTGLSDQLDMIQEASKIQYHVTIAIEVKNIEQALEQLTIESRSLGGEIKLKDNTNNQELIEDIMIKIPLQKMDDFSSDLDEIGNIKSHEVYNRDITNDLTILQSYLKNSRELEKQYLSIINHSGSKLEIDDAYTKLASIREEIRRLEADFKQWSEDSNYYTATISLDLESRLLNSSPRMKNK